MEMERMPRLNKPFTTYSKRGTIILLFYQASQLPIYFAVYKVNLVNG